MSVVVEDHACELREVVDSTTCRDDAPLQMQTRGERGVVTLNCDAPGGKRRERPDEPVCWAPQALEDTLFKLSEHSVENGKEVFAYPATSASQNYLEALRGYHPFDPTGVRPQDPEGRYRRIVVTPRDVDGSASHETVGEMLERLKREYDPEGEANLEEDARERESVTLDHASWRANARVYDAYFRVLDAQDSENNPSSVRPYETARLALEDRFGESGEGEPLRESEARHFLSLNVSVPSPESASDWVTNNLLLKKSEWDEALRRVYAGYSEAFVDAVDDWFAENPSADRLSVDFVEGRIRVGDVRTPAHLRARWTHAAPNHPLFPENEDGDASFQGDGKSGEPRMVRSFLLYLSREHIPRIDPTRVLRADLVYENDEGVVVPVTTVELVTTWIIQQWNRDNLDVGVYDILDRENAEEMYEDFRDDTLNLREEEDDEFTEAWDYDST